MLTMTGGKEADKLHGITAINGEILPFAPIKMTIKKSDLYSDSSKRSAETGRLMLYPIRKNIYTLELEFLLDSGQTEFLENTLEILGTKIIVQFDENGTKKSLETYLSDRTKELQGTENSRKYRISFSLTEI